MTKKKIRRKLKIKNILIGLVILILIVNFIYMILELPIKNIYIVGNNILSDEAIINDAKLSDYPSFLLSLSHNIKKNIENNPLVADVTIKKKWWGKIYINIEENNPLCIEASSGKVILDNGNKIENLYNIDEIPYLLSNVDSIYENFIKKFSLLNKDILLQISEINYSPVNVDKERFYLSMNDGNYVYITLTKIKRLNKYGEIKEELQGKTGIVYLDSGNYIEVKD